jgi:hypothetical protein
MASVATLWFGTGSLAAFLAASALAAWTQGESFQVLGALSVVATLLGLAGFAVGAAAARRFPLRNPSLLAGAASAAAFIAVLWIAALAGADPREWWALVLMLPLLGGLAACLPGLAGASPSR